MIFVDTGGWVGYISPDDEYHLQAKDWMHGNRQILVTTDYVLDESLTLLKARGEPARAQQLGSLLFGDVGTATATATAAATAAATDSPSLSAANIGSGSIVRLYYLTPDDILAAWQVFRRYEDKEWSFTDCTSKVVIEKLGLTRAFSFDHHFHQFGTVSVVPESL
jgi:predicted nucleic acid-binding protein